MHPSSPTVFSFAAFVYDAENRRLTRNRIPVRINKQMLDLLDLLIRNEGRLVTREQIRLSLWPDEVLDNREKQITNAVSRLRHILDDNTARHRFIESVPRTGYRWIAPVSPVPLSPVPVSNGTLPAPPPHKPAHQSSVVLSPSSDISGQAESSPEALPRTEDAPTPAVATESTASHASPKRRLLFAAASMLLFLAAVIGAWRIYTHATPKPPAEISLGIAPFHADGAEALAQSFRLDLTDTLAQLPHVNLRASHSLDLLSLDQATFRDQAMRLGLDVLIIGSFTVQGDNCHVQLELVRGKDLSHIANFDRTVSRYELASLRDAIRNDVYADLRLAPSRNAISRSPVGGTSDPRAYDAYLRASFHFSQQTSESLPLAISEYNQAIAADPQFVNAYAALARTYVYLVQNDLIGEAEGYRLANSAARQALNLDPHSAAAHATLGFLYFFRDWNLIAGESELRQAISTNPGEPFYHQGLALVFCDEGRFHEAEAEIDQAHVVDPFWTSAYVTEAHIASVAGDRTRAQNAIRKLMELAPDSAHARDGIGNAQWNLGLYPDAISTWRQMAVLEKDAPRIAMEDRGLAAYREGGVPAYARVRIDAIRKGMNTTPHSNDFFPPEWYAQAGETEEALNAIRAAIARHDSSVPGMAQIPAYASLRSTPEFEAALNSAGLQPPPRFSR